MPYLESNSSSSPSCPTIDSNDAFHKLVRDLSAALGPSSGLDSDDVDPMDIQTLMERYTSASDQWLPYAFEDTSRAYTRNLIDEGNGKSNLLILVWSPGKASAIHDHANAHCVMKILKGSLQETQYAWPEEEKVKNGESSPLEITKQTVYGENEVTYMSDKVSLVASISLSPHGRFGTHRPKLGLHKISNPDPEHSAVSLHLYTPPNAAHYGFSIFDERTGQSRHIKQSNFFSDKGQRL